MAKEKKEQTENELSIDKLISNTNFDKYRLVPLAARWAEELKQKEEYKYSTTAELLDAALKDILTGKISIEEIAKLPPKEIKKKSGEKTKVKT